MLTLFATAFGLGLAFSAPPGAVTAEVWRRGLSGGFRPAFLFAAGSLVGDAVWAALALTGAAVIVESDIGRTSLARAGAIVLFVLAVKALVAAQRPQPPRARQTLGSRGALAAGALISLGNPWAAAFWIGVGAGVTSAVGEGRSGLAVFFGGFMLAALLWSLFVAAAVAWIHRRTGASFARFANLAAAVVLSYFGIRLLWSSV